MTGGEKLGNGTEGDSWLEEEEEEEKNGKTVDPAQK